jgi:hypothetical protein
VENSDRYTAVVNGNDNRLLTMRYINQALTRLDDEITAQVQDFRVTTSVFTLASGTNTEGLPALYYKLRRIYYTEADGRVVKIEPFMLEEETLISESAVLVGGGQSRIRYAMVGDNLRFAPMPEQDYDVTIEYVRTTPIFVDPTMDEVLDFVNGWDRFVVNEVGAYIIELEGRDGSSFQAKAERELQGILSAAMERNHADPDHMVWLPNDQYYRRSRA